MGHIDPVPLLTGGFLEEARLDPEFDTLLGFLVGNTYPLRVAANGDELRIRSCRLRTKIFNQGWHGFSRIVCRVIRVCW